MDGRGRAVPEKGLPEKARFPWPFKISHHVQLQIQERARISALSPLLPLALTSRADSSILERASSGTGRWCLFLLLVPPRSVSDFFSGSGEQLYRGDQLLSMGASWPRSSASTLGLHFPATKARSLVVSLYITPIFAYTHRSPAH